MIRKMCLLPAIQNPGIPGFSLSLWVCCMGLTRNLCLIQWYRILCPTCTLEVFIDDIQLQCFSKRITHPFRNTKKLFIFYVMGGMLLFLIIIIHVICIGGKSILLSLWNNTIYSR